MAHDVTCDVCDVRHACLVKEFECDLSQHLPHCLQVGQAGGHRHREETEHVGVMCGRESM